MNAVFDLNRWLLYIGKHWNENKRKYLLSLAAVGGLQLLWYSFMLIVKPKHPMEISTQTITYYVGLFLTGCLFASLAFSELSDSPKAIHYLLTPVSAFEKLLTAILYGVILFFICYTVVFYAIDFIMLKVTNSLVSTRLEHLHLNPVKPEELVNVFVAPQQGDNYYMYFLLAFFAIQSIFLLGSVYFVKFHFIKTLVSGLVVFLFLVFFVHKVMGSFMPEGGFYKPFTDYRLYSRHNQEDQSIHLPQWYSIILLFLTKYALAPCLWVVTYFRLKEKEV